MVKVTIPKFTLNWLRKTNLSLTTASFIKLKVKLRTDSFMKDLYFPIKLQFAVAAELVV